MQPHWTPLIVEVPITVDTDAYTAEDVVGGTLTSDEVAQIKGGGYIHWVRVTDDDDEKAALRLYVYNAAPSTIADDAAFAPTEADWLKTLGCISIAATDYDASGSEACALVAGKDRMTNDYVFFDNLATGRLYFRLVCVGTPTYTDANDITIHVCVMVM